MLVNPYLELAEEGREGIKKEDYSQSSLTPLNGSSTRSFQLLLTTIELHVSYFENLCRKVFTFCEVTLKLRGFSRTVHK